jgi:hypothetical protein
MGTGMNVVLLKSLIAFVPAALLFSGSALCARKRVPYSFLQLVGAGALLLVVVSHIFEALHVFSWMQWGMEGSVGHYVDLFSAAIGITVFSIGYLLSAMVMRPAVP